MLLPVAYQNQFKQVSVRAYWLPEFDSAGIVILDKSDESALDRGPIHCNTAGSFDLMRENPIFNSTNGSSICCGALHLGEDDRLSVQERATLSSITSPSMHHQKSWSFLLTRMVLGEILQQDPKTIELDREGKPRLLPSFILGKGEEGDRDRGPISCNTTGSSDLNSKHPNLNAINRSSVCGASDLADDDGVLHFNVSHSDNLWIIAWSFNTPVGIDVQKIDAEVNYQAVMRQFFTSSERAKVNTVFDFFDLWTQKEAVLKLRGLSFAHMPKISTDSATLIPLDIAPEFKAHIAL